jgi:hypothetical protein
MTIVFLAAGIFNPARAAEPDGVTPQARKDFEWFGTLEKKETQTPPPYGRHPRLYARSIQWLNRSRPAIFAQAMRLRRAGDRHNPGLLRQRLNGFWSSPRSFS